MDGERAEAHGGMRVSGILLSCPHVSLVKSRCGIYWFDFFFPNFLSCTHGCLPARLRSPFYCSMFLSRLKPDHDSGPSKV